MYQIPQLWNNQLAIFDVYIWLVANVNQCLLWSTLLFQTKVTNLTPLLLQCSVLPVCLWEVLLYIE